MGSKGLKLKKSITHKLPSCPVIVDWVQSRAVNIRDSSQKKSHVSHSSGSVESGGVYDLGFSGPKFTWSRGSLHQRLDRYLANLYFFPDSTVFHLDRLGWDHRSLVLRLHNVNQITNSKPFRFVFAWQDHPSFSDLIKSSWNSGGDLVSNFVGLQGKLSEWNVSTFGSIGQCKRRLLARLRGIDRVLQDRHSTFLVELEKQLRD
ncbi:hypothetical protein F3Y22_tig00000991pilonHSYRG00190 [Hibiscus syriacus]|uniref:Uncharacterized protein n=1 Tax=Hibiscus syriacus TaxID=106335 RepID=A0A6A3CWV2_HIBSY|nr:hypothetical protein F3Y22_tig00000991pilonHSYRG00190 [Hibiscus syriacus]